MNEQMVFNVSTARAFITLSLLGAMLVPCAYAASDDGLQCSGKLDNSERLECYDALNAGRLQEEKTPAAAQPVEVTSTVARSYLTRSWDLDNKDDELSGEHQSPLKPHRVSYMIVRRTSETNMQPYSPSHGSVTVPSGIDLTELKFQISQKAKLFNPVSIGFFGY